MIPPYSNVFIKCRMAKAKGKAYIGRSCVFEPLFKHRSLYSQYETYEGLVTVGDHIVRSGVFTIVMINKSNRDIKIHSNQTMGMLHCCEDSQVSTIHEIIIFDKNAKKGRDGKSDLGLYYVPTRNPRMGRLEVNTLQKKDFYSMQVNEVGPNMTMCITGSQVYWMHRLPNRPDMTWKDCWRRTMMPLQKMRGRLELLFL